MNFDNCCQVSTEAISPGLSVNGISGKERQTILVVDDEEIVLEVTREILESLGYWAFTACSATEGIALYQFRKETIDLVILDMILSDMGGEETFNRLKLIDPKVKVILSTGYSLSGPAKLIMERGCNGFIQKPFKIEELSRKVREVLEPDKSYAVAS